MSALLENYLEEARTTPLSFSWRVSFKISGKKKIHEATINLLFWDQTAATKLLAEIYGFRAENIRIKDARLIA